MTQQESKLNVEFVELRHRDEPSIQISILVNSIYYFIESVFIVNVKKVYRLVAVHQGRLLADETYKTARGAKIAFLKRYGKKTWQNGVKAEWTRFYPPEPVWFGEKFLEDKK